MYLSWLKSHYRFLLPFFLPLVLYLNTLSFSFVWDDHFYILNRGEHSPLSFSSLLAGEYPVAGNPVYRPLRNLMYPVTYAVFSDHPLGYHATAIFLFALNLILVWHFVSLLSPSRLLAYLTVLLFSLHPIHVESIAWVTAAFDQLFVTFYFLALTFYLKSEKNPGFIRPTICIAALALLSNELALTLPLVFLLLDVTLLGHHPRLRFRSRYLPFLALVGMYLFLRLYFRDGFGFSVSPFSGIGFQLLFSLWLVGKYLLQLLFPFRLGVDLPLLGQLSSLFGQNHPASAALPFPDVSAQLLAPLLTLSIFLIAILSFRKRFPLLIFSLSFTLIALLPVAQLIPLTVLYADRYAYLASFGFCLSLAWLLVTLYQIKSYRLFFYLGTFFWISLFTYGLLTAIPIWRNDFSLWTHTQLHNPGSAIAANSLGTYYYNRGDYSSALTQYRQAISLFPTHPSYQKNYLLSLTRLGLFDEASSFLQAQLTLYPHDPLLLINLASLYQDYLDQPGKALEYFQKAQVYLPREPFLNLQIQDLKAKLQDIN